MMEKPNIISQTLKEAFDVWASPMPLEPKLVQVAIILNNSSDLTIYAFLREMAKGLPTMEAK